jgi:hypothetical protein
MAIDGWIDRGAALQVQQQQPHQQDRSRATPEEEEDMWRRMHMQG